MEINQEAINKLVDERMLTIVSEISKELLKEYEKIDSINHDYVNKIINYTVDALLSKINQLRIENTIDIMFIKAVLYTHGLSNGELYNKYKEEWYRLNPSSDYRNTTADTNNSNSDITAKYSETKDNIDIVDSGKIISNEYINSSPYISVDKACKHDKIYDKYILTSNPPQQRWKCKKCEETGIDIIGTV